MEGLSKWCNPINFNKYLSQFLEGVIGCLNKWNSNVCLCADI